MIDDLQRCGEMTDKLVLHQKKSRNLCYPQQYQETHYMVVPSIENMSLLYTNARSWVVLVYFDPNMYTGILKSSQTMQKETSMPTTKMFFLMFWILRNLQRRIFTVMDCSSLN